MESSSLRTGMMTLIFILEPENKSYAEILLLISLP